MPKYYFEKKNNSHSHFAFHKKKKASPLYGLFPEFVFDTALSIQGKVYGNMFRKSYPIIRPDNVPPQ